MSKSLDTSLVITINQYVWRMIYVCTNRWCSLAIELLGTFPWLHLRRVQCISISKTAPFINTNVYTNGNMEILISYQNRYFNVMYFLSGCLHRRFSVVVEVGVSASLT